MDGGKGLELRDWLAGQALAGILMNPNTPRAGEGPLEEHADAIAEQAYAYADALLRRRGTPPADARAPTASGLPKAPEVAPKGGKGDAPEQDPAKKGRREKK